jgi:Protein of unknown function (DUF1176)
MIVRGFSSLLAVMLAGCLPPASERYELPKMIQQGVAKIGPWDMGCDNLGRCIAIGAVPPRKVQMDGIRGALRIEFDNPDGMAAGLTVIPMDFEQRLPDVKLSGETAQIVLTKLRAGDDFLIWINDSDGSRYYVPGQGFGLLEQTYAQWQSRYPVRIVQQEPILPSRATPLPNFRAPLLTEGQATDCGSSENSRIEAVWDLIEQSRLLKYRCANEAKFNPISLWYIQDKRNGALAPIGLPEAVGELQEGGAAGLVGARFAPAAGLLVTRKLAAPSGDCGAVITYALTPSGFLLAQKNEARHCVGLFSGDWVRTYADPRIMLPDYW